MKNVSHHLSVPFFASGLVLFTCVAAPAVCCGETFYWTGAAKEPSSDKNYTPSLETVENWAYADGTVPTRAPDERDDVIFTNTVSQTLWSGCKHIIPYEASEGTKYRVMLYNTLTLTNDASVSFHAPMKITNVIDDVKVEFVSQLSFATNGICHYSTGTLEFKRSCKPQGGSSGAPIVYPIHVEYPAATFKLSSHIQPEGYSRYVKTGRGIFIPFSSTYYPPKGDVALWLEEGEMRFPSATVQNSNPLNRLALVYKGTNAKTMSFTKANGLYLMATVPQEIDVVGTQHVLTDSGAGATLSFTNYVMSKKAMLQTCRFSGTLAGKLSLVWDGVCYGLPSETTVPTLTLAAGTSTSTGTLTARSGTVTITEGAVYRTLSSVKVEKAGTLAVSGDAVLETPALTIDAGGTLDIAADHVVTVSNFTYAGTPQAVGYYGKASGVGITGDGALYVSSDIVVPYDASTKTATPVDLRTSSFTHALVALSGPVPLRLSESVLLPFHETNRLQVASFLPASGLLPGDFADVTPKTCDLPVTWFETEDVEGVRKVYLCARPVVTASLYKGSGSNVAYNFMCEEDKGMWSDGQVPHAGADYYIGCGGDTKTIFCNSLDSGSSLTAFPGFTLTVNHSRYRSSMSNFATDLRVYGCDGSSYRRIEIDSNKAVTGTIYLDGATSPLVRLTSEVNKKVNVAATITGTAGTRLEFGHNWDATTNVTYRVTGDLSGFAGSVWIKGECISRTATWNDQTVIITSATALGGPMAEATTGGFRIDGFSKLVADDDVVLDAVNRNIHVCNGARLSVAEGKTLAFMNPVTSCDVNSAEFEAYCPQRCFVEKTGAGLLLFGSTVSMTTKTYAPSVADETNNLVRVKEGGIGTRATTAFDRLLVTFADGTFVDVDPATAADGLRLLDYKPQIAAGATVTLRTAKGFEPSAAEFRVNFLTVPAATPDLTANLTVAPLRGSFGGWRGTLEKENATIEGVSCTRYFATYRKHGFAIIFR